MENCETKSVRSGWRSGLFKHVGLITIAVATSGVLMSRVKGGWSLEPLIWLALAWYLGLLFVVDFLLFRGRGRIKTLLVILTGVAVLIMFPFSAIRKAEYRARLRADLGQQGRIEKVHLLKQWNWWELPTGECIPRCLAWRVPVDGIDRQSQLYYLTANEFADFPKWFVDEVDFLQIGVDGTPPRFLRNRFTPRTLAMYSLDPFRSLREKPRYNIDWIDKVVSLDRCNEISLIQVCASAATWTKLLTGREVHELSVRESTISDENWHCDLPQLQSLIVNDTTLGSQSLKKLVSGSPSLKKIAISVDQFTDDFAKEVASKSDFNISIVGSVGWGRSRTRSGLQINQEIAFDGKVELTLFDFASFNFADSHLQTLIRSTKSTEISGCTLSFRNVKDIIEFELVDKVVSSGNSMDSHELQLLVDWIAEESGDSKFLATKIYHLDALHLYLQDPNSSEFPGLFELIMRKVKK